MSRVKVQNLTKRYGAVVAVDNISFEVADAEFLAVLGPSGCGKTSTMRVIAGLERPDTGQVWLGERVVNSLGPAERNVAMAFENYGLYPHWTVFQNISYPLRMRGVSAEEISKKVAAVVSLLKIDDLLSLRPASISGGAKQRVGLARALVRSPEVFLLDEPMSHVDPDFRSQLRVELKRVQRELGGTFIYVTHDQLEAMSMADRILVMRDGVIQQIGTPYDVFNNPASEFVAGFVGEPPMNLLPVRLQEGNSGLSLILPNGGYAQLPSRYTRMIESLRGAELKLGIRPHKIRIGAEQPAEGVIPGCVYVIEPLGDYTVVTVKVGDNTVKVEGPTGFSASPDEMVRLVFSPWECLLFNDSTGRLITEGD